MEKNKTSDQVDITAPILPEEEPKKTYAEAFLNREEIKERKSVYIDKNTHTKVSRLVHAFALSGVEISVGSYIDNIIAEHLDYFKGYISGYCRKGLDDLL